MARVLSWEQTVWSIKSEYLYRDICLWMTQATAFSCLQAGLSTTFIGVTPVSSDFSEMACHMLAQLF